jgi:hypothetical protein
LNLSDNDGVRDGDGVSDGDGVRDDATGSGTATGVGDDDGDAASSVEAEGRVKDGFGDGDGVASREVAAASRLSSLMAQNQISPRLGFRIGGGNPLIPDTLLVSVDVIQPIPKNSFMVSAGLCQLIPTKLGL